VRLPASAASISIGSVGGRWSLTEGDRGSFIASGTAGQSSRIERDGWRLRAQRAAGQTPTLAESPLVARPEGSAMLTVDGKQYRGEIVVQASDTGLIIVNRLRIDDYLRGVVPLEMGPRAPSDSAALQAQAITARSYAFVHLASPRSVAYDVAAGVLDQVYGGASAETPASDRAIESTRTLVLKYAGRVVNAPYHAVCGGTTAEPQEVWRATPESYLQRVSDLIPGSSRSYCDIAPRFQWVRSYTAGELDAVIARYMSQYASVPAGGVGRVRGLSPASQTASGRVGTLTVSTDRGNFVLRGNDIRFVLRTNTGGEILNSTYFSVESERDMSGSLSRVTLRGSGNGHGIGMCQWGAIGRARAGQSFRTILATYYPGTAVGPME
jgi:stage II sporulation protein D